MNRPWAGFPCGVTRWRGASAPSRCCNAVMLRELIPNRALGDPPPSRRYGYPAMMAGRDELAVGDVVTHNALRQVLQAVAARTI